MTGTEARPNMYSSGRKITHLWSGSDKSPENISELLHPKSLCYPRSDAEKVSSDSEGDECQISNRTYAVENAISISYLNRKGLLKEICKKYKVHMDSDEVQPVIKICGWNQQVKKAIEEIRSYLKTMLVDSVQFYSLKARKYFLSDIGQKYLAGMCEEHDISIDITEEHERNSKDVDGDFNSPISWSFTNGKSLILAKGSVLSTNASVGLVPLNTPKDASFTGVLQEVTNQPWIDGKKNKIKILEASLKRVFNKVRQDQNCSVAISLDIHQDWPFSVYLPSLFELCMKVLTAGVGCPKEIIFCAVTEGQFKDAMKLLDALMDAGIECMELCRKDIFPVKKPQVKIVKGELDKVKADVIVNTTSTDLDLSHGSVSTALLKSGGQELQAECWEKYPSGLLNTHIVITTGQKLNCHSVYHVSLQHYSPDMALHCQEFLRYLVWTCLKTATEQCAKSIAFPAMGTGMLKYPPDLVASEMFTTMTRFRNTCPATSLEEILFVIYPKNTPVIQAFYKVQKDIETASRHRLRSKVTINVAGSKQAVDCVKEELNKKSLKVPIDFDVITEEVIPVVMDSEYFAMLNFFSSDMEQISKSLEEYRYCDHNRIILKGKFADVEDAVSLLKQCIDKICNMSVKKLDVPHGLNTMFVNEIIQTPAIQNKDVFCYFDNKNLLITIYGESQSKVDQVYKELSKLLLSCINQSKDIVHSLDGQQRMSNVEDKMMSMDDATNRDSLIVSGSNQITPNVAMQEGIGREDSVLEKHLNEGKEVGHGENMRSGSTNGKTENEQEKCAICLDPITKPKQLKCSHSFCTDCIDEYFKIKQVCPACGMVCGVIVGDQPNGEMMINKINTTLAGYSDSQTLLIAYIFQAGQQTGKHPTPGAEYQGIYRVAYLPDNDEGRKICVMLKTAFERRLVFTIGTSRTTGQQGVITWNDIHHKTDSRPNAQFGYPDPTYLERIKDELAAKGVTEADLDLNLYRDLEKPFGVCKVTIVTNK